MRDWLEEVKRRLSPAGLEGAAEGDIAEELAQHLQDRYEELCARGVAAAVARAQVLAELGEDDVLARGVRDVMPARKGDLSLGRPTFGSRFGGMWADLRFGARMLARTKVHTAVSVLVMALGIGANTVIFIVVNSLLLQPPSGVAEPERLAAIFTSDYSGPRFGSSSYPDMVALRESGGVFEDVAAYALQTFSMVGAGWSARGMGEIVSDNYFHALGVRPALGRFFSAEEGVPGKTSSVVVISDDLWREQFGSRRDALGKTIFVKGQPFTVVGVAPPDFGGSVRGLRTELWLPVSLPSGVYGVDAFHRGNRGFQVRARLQEGSDIGAAQQQLNVVAARLHGEFPDAWTDVNEQSRVFTIVPESEARVPRQMRGAVIGFLGLLMAAVFAVLLIACTNVANLMLSRASARRAEMGVRLALGATRGRIVRHLLAESVLLASLGGAAGVLLALWLTGLLNAVRLPGIHVTIQVALDAQVVAFATVITLVTGILFGLAPALQASRAPAPMLRDDARSGNRSRARHALIVVQVAATLILLVGGGLFLRSLRAAQDMDTGYDAGNVVIAGLNLDQEGYSAERSAVFFEELMRRVGALPGTSAMTLAEQVPLGLGWSRRHIEVEGYEPGEGEDMEVGFNAVAPDYFRTMGVRLRRGRDFSAADRSGAPPVVIVSEAFVRRFWPGQNALGKRVGLAGPDAPFAEVIAVAPDALYRALDDEPQPYFYYPYLQDPSASMYLLARTTGDPGALAALLRAEIRRLAPAIPPLDVRTFREHAALAALPQRVAAILLSSLGLLGLSIAIIGLYGLVAFSVVQRVREFGIRLALGAVPRDVRLLVVGEALRLVALGIVCGVPVAIAGAYLARSFLMVQPLDPVTFLGVPALLAACALLASYAPARRATALDPASALRAP